MTYIRMNPYSISHRLAFPRSAVITFPKTIFTGKKKERKQRLMMKQEQGVKQPGTSTTRSCSSATSSSLNVVVHELHVFDFDGTIFRSPAPHAKHKMIPAPSNAKFRSGYGGGGGGSRGGRRRGGRGGYYNNNESSFESMHHYITSPKSVGGLGWFQNYRSLSHPYIAPTIEEVHRRTLAEDGSPLYVEEVVEALDAVIDRKKSRGDVYIVVLTGRDYRFREQLTQLLDSGGFTCTGPKPLIDELILKDTIDGGTVKYKVGAFLDLIFRTDDWNHSLPRKGCCVPDCTLCAAGKTQVAKIVYYEDRPDQGEKISATIQELLCQLQEYYAEAAQAGSRAAGNAIKSSSYDDYFAEVASIRESKINHRMVNNNCVSQLLKQTIRELEQSVAYRQMFDAGQVPKMVTFEMRMIRVEENFLSAEMEERLLRELAE